MKYHLLLLVLLLYSVSVFSQPIFLRTGTVRPEQNISQRSLDSFSKKIPRFAGKSFAVLQFDHLPSAEERSQLAASGMELLDYLPQNAFTVSFSGSPSAKALQGLRAKALFQLSPQQKMQEYFAKGQIPSWAVKVAGTVDVWLSFYKTLEPSVVLQQLKELNVDILSAEYLSYRIISLRIAANRITEIAALPFVEYLQPAPPEDLPLNDNSRIGARANVLNAAVANGGYGLNGEGVIVGHGDNADLQSHVDFTGRLINRNASPFSAHGAHTAGTIAGAGNILELYRGYAPKAVLLSQWFSNILNHSADYVRDYRMVITNNSYGNIIDCEYHGTYDLTSRMVDQQMLDLPNLLHVFAAGNSGLNTCGPYPTSYRTVLGGYQSAKNIITVGATTDSGMIANFSSRGPVKDGRTKPEIVAMGQNVASTWPTNTYSYNNGTSMAAPAISGGLALLYQRYRQLHGGADPKNGLMKAILCNGATDKGASGPDFYYGFGAMNLLRSVAMLDSTRFFSGSSTNGGATTHRISVPASTAQLKVLLYWNDLPAAIISTKNLVNDLDLEVVDPTGTIVLPKISDTTINALGNAATNGADHMNNMEQVVINNPAAGMYTLRIKGTTVTNLEQEYFVTYDPVPTGLKLTAPAGDMALVPGEATKISWDSYGFSGSATLELSTDGGTTWTTINPAVDVNRGVYSWTAPAVATDNALIRVTKNGGGASSVSNRFTILGSPVLSMSTVQCNGYFAINWTAVQSATDYEVMILRGNEMKPVATTTATSFTFSGLSKDSVYFVSVRARVNGAPGRRATAISRQPIDGNCEGSISDNDVRMDAVLSPRSGRKETATELGTGEQVRVRIKNLDNVPVSNFTISYAVNGGTPVMETVTTPVMAGDVYVHTFSAPYNFSTPGAYTITAAVTKNGDLVAANDTLTVVVKQIENASINLATAFADNMETAVPATYERDTIGLAGIERYDFSRTTAYGRLRTFVDSDLALSGTKALTLDASRLVSGGNINYLYGTFNLRNYTAATNDIRLDFRFLHHSQLENTANRVWIRGSDTASWIEVYNLDSARGVKGVYQKTSSIGLSGFLLSNGQNVSSSFQVRWGQWGQWPATDKESAAGYTIDDIRLYQVFNDIELVRIGSPAVNSCGLTTAEQVMVSVRNNSNATVTNVPIRYRINGAAFVSEIIPSLPARSTIQYTFSTRAGMGSFGTHSVQALVDLPGDSFKENDTASLTLYNQPLITTFPYLENFELNDGHFYAGGRRSSWEYGTPDSRKITGAASGAKAWKTSLQGFYNDKELSYLYSPCFDLSGMTAPTLSFSLALDIEDCGTTTCDAAWVEYSVDGLNWTKLVTADSGTNWYNKTAPRNHWSIQNYTWWHVATQLLPKGINRLRLRFVMSSDQEAAREGIAIDDIHIYDNTKGIYEGPTLSSPVTQTVAGNNWIDFTADGKLVASVQPKNQSLGTTAVQAYVNDGAIRFSGNQYYHNRNITIKPTAAAHDTVLVRFYFTDRETDSLLKATSCPGCTKPGSAYELGITQYTDDDKAAENGSLADNQQGLWNFISSAQVAKIPFDKGYYAEFKTVNFSEFWLNGGGADLVSSLPVKLVSLTALKQGNNAVLNWKVGSETDVLRYEVEVARGDDALQANAYAKIGEVTSPGNTTASRSYSFTDAEADKFGARYYRLKVVNRDGTFRYSPVRAVVFESAVTWQAYPNPGSGIFYVAYQLTAGESLAARLYDTKGSLVKEYRSAATGFLQKLIVDISANNYASGVYLLRLHTGGKEQVMKLYKQ